MKRERVNLYEEIMSSQDEYTSPEILELLAARNQKGLDTYGESLHSFNGRNAAQDALEEAADLLMYVYQMVREFSVVDEDGELTTEETRDSVVELSHHVARSLHYLMAIKPVYDEVVHG